MKWLCVRSTPNHRKSNFRNGLTLIAAVLCLFIVSSCGDQPDDLIDENTYVDILVEVHVMNAISDQYEDPAMTFEVQESILEEYDITKEQFDASHQWYIQDIPRQRERLTVARDRLNEELQRLNDKLMDRQQESREEQQEEAQQEQQREQREQQEQQRQNNL